MTQAEYEQAIKDIYAEYDRRSKEPNPITEPDIWLERRIDILDAQFMKHDENYTDERCKEKPGCIGSVGHLGECVP